MHELREPCAPKLKQKSLFSHSTPLTSRGDRIELSHLRVQSQNAVLNARGVLTVGAHSLLAPLPVFEFLKDLLGRLRCRVIEHRLTRDRARGLAGCGHSHGCTICGNGREYRVFLETPRSLFRESGNLKFSQRPGFEEIQH